MYKMYKHIQYCCLPFDRFSVVQLRSLLKVGESTKLSVTKIFLGFQATNGNQQLVEQRKREEKENSHLLLATLRRLPTAS